MTFDFRPGGTLSNNVCHVISLGITFGEKHLRTSSILPTTAKFDEVLFLVVNKIVYRCAGVMYNICALVCWV